MTEAASAKVPQAHICEVSKNARPCGDPADRLMRFQLHCTSHQRRPEDAEKSELLEALLYEAANWKELVRRPDVGDMREWTRYVGSRAAYARLAGNTKVYEAAIKDILDRARPIAEGKGSVIQFAKALFLNARPAQAIAVRAVLSRPGGWLVGQPQAFSGDAAPLSDVRVRWADLGVTVVPAAGAVTVTPYVRLDQVALHGPTLPLAQLGDALGPRTLLGQGPAAHGVAAGQPER